VASQTPDLPEEAGVAGLLEFLSPEWLQALEGALNELGAQPDDTEPIAVGQIVTDGPFAEGELRYTVLLADDTARVAVGSLEGADVVLVTGYADAVALATGERTAGSVLAAGGMKLSGDVARLVGAVTLVERAAGATRSLLARTRYR